MTPARLAGRLPRALDPLSLRKYESRLRLKLDILYLSSTAASAKTQLHWVLECCLDKACLVLFEMPLHLTWSDTFN